MVMRMERESQGPLLLVDFEICYDAIRLLVFCFGFAFSGKGGDVTFVHASHFVYLESKRFELNVMKWLARSTTTV